MLRRKGSPAKVIDYLLSDSHPDGGSKARFFRSFGFVAEDADTLMTTLFDHPIRNSVAAVKQTPFGDKYVVRCEIETPDGRNPCITSTWVVEAGEGPRLVTAYPDRSSP